MRRPAIPGEGNDDGAAILDAKRDDDPGAMGALATARTDPMALVARHFAGEWNGQPDNAARNEEYLRDGEGMLMSIFEVGGERIWVISHVGFGEGDYTTVLLPEEY